MGACATAFHGGLATIGHTEQFDSSGGGVALNSVIKNVENFPVNHTEQFDSSGGGVELNSLIDKTEQFDPVFVSVQRKCTTGRGNTATKGPHATRYKAYYRAVKKGDLKPSQYAFIRYVFGGEKIGSETARIWLSAMEQDGLISPTVYRGKPAYVLSESAKAL